MDIQFTDNSVDPENKSISWLWDFGDGNTSEIQTPTHKFTTEGDYNVTLTVKDDENATDTFTMTISVTEPPQSDSGATPLWIIAVVAIVIATIGLLGMF
jgi:PKD repeat protein